MALEGWKVEPISFKSARPFVEQWHYSRSVNGLHVTQCFGLFKPRPEFFGIPEMVGAIVYGKPAMTNQASKWCPNDPDGLLELRRLACIDDTPKNTESFFISKTLKWLEKNTNTKVIVAYADPKFGHDGTVYRAANFKLIGMTSPGILLEVDGKLYHDRTLRIDKPYARKIKERLEVNDPDVRIIETDSKYIFLYKFEELDLTNTE